MSDSSIQTIDQIGQAANLVASRHVFDDYRQRKAENTLRRQDADLALFADYLAQLQPADDDSDIDERGRQLATRLATDPAAWSGITWGLVAGFVQWMLQGEYATGSVNVRLSTIKTYAKLASKAGALDKLEYLQIKDVTGYSPKERKRLDEKRTGAGANIRRQDKGTKKADPIQLAPSKVKRLKTDYADSPQGRRDGLLMCLLLDLGLRCGEAALLSVDMVNMQAGELKFYRPKVDKVQTMNLKKHTHLWRAIQRWFDSDALPVGPLLRGSVKGGVLTGTGMSERAITKRVQVLGARLDIERLSAHDCRHSWATRAARAGTNPFALQEAGGWNSLAMPRRYVEDAKIANAGVMSDDDD